MQNLIHLLPDAIANQIAAGEVVQRPASVVKELLENAVDAGATRIDIAIKQAGKTLIQVSDDGRGMSAQDARMAFERHATSKIRSQDDLFGIRTLGFRGEALASIAAVAQVRLRTRLQTEELGVELDIEASKLVQQQACACKAGSLFQIKNLFFNVPARRNFLKSNPVETRHILNEFVRVALSKPELRLSLIHNDTQVYDLVEEELEQRIVDLLGKDLKGKLIPVEAATSYASIRGVIGDPSVARKQRGEQFFFVNGRYIRSNYLNHAISTAFQEFIAKETYPFYCLFLEIDPVHVDINIHPTKTEVKFDDERTLYVLLQGMIKRGLGEFHAAPQLEQQTNSGTESPFYPNRPSVSSSPSSNALPRVPSHSPPPRKVDWDQLYAPPPPKEEPILSPQKDLFEDEEVKTEESKEVEPDLLVQIQGRYVLTQQDACLLLIDQRLAHQRILYESFLRALKGQSLPCQQLLFPETLEFSPMDYQTIREVDDVLEKMGFEVKEFGRNALIVYGIPIGVEIGELAKMFEQIISDVRQTGATTIDNRHTEGIARTVAMRSAVTSRQKMSMLEMRQMLQDLFQCEAPGFAPNGKPTMKRISFSELESFFS